MRVTDCYYIELISHRFYVPAAAMLRWGYTGSRIMRKKKKPFSFFGFI